MYVGFISFVRSVCNKRPSLIVGQNFHVFHSHFLCAYTIFFPLYFVFYLHILCCTWDGKDSNMVENRCSFRELPLQSRWQEKECNLQGVHFHVNIMCVFGLNMQTLKNVRQYATLFPYALLVCFIVEFLPFLRQ